MIPLGFRPYASGYEACPILRADDDALIRLYRRIWLIPHYTGINVISKLYSKTPLGGAITRHTNDGTTIHIEQDRRVMLYHGHEVAGFCLESNTNRSWKRPLRQSLSRSLNRHLRHIIAMMGVCLIPWGGFAKTHWKLAASLDSGYIVLGTSQSGRRCSNNIINSYT